MAGTKLNPKIREIEIGVRTIKTIKIWPLSLADELKFTETIAGLVQEYEEIGKLPEVLDNLDFTEDLQTVENLEVKITQFIIEAIRENLIELLELVSDEPVSLSDIDNEQFADICDLIFEMNFAGAVGKFKSLLVKVKNLLHPKTQLQNLSSQPVTDTNTSSDSPTEKEE